jgi:hypothetical protein
MIGPISVSDITPDQQRAIRLGVDSHSVVVGGPGSGKTQVLLYRAARLLERSEGDDARLQLFVPSAVLKRYLFGALHELNIPRSCVSTFDAWCVSFCRANLKRTVPRQRQSGQPDLHRLRAELAEALQGLAKGEKPLRFALVDDLADLDANLLELIAAASDHVSLAVDSGRWTQLSQSARLGALARLGLKRVTVTLLETYRCSPYVTEFASGFISGPDATAQWMAQAMGGERERETPYVYVRADADDEMKRLADVLQTRLLNNERVGVLVPTVSDVALVAAWLAECGFEVETEGEADFKTEPVKVLSYEQARGLTFDSVLLPRVVPESFDGADIESTRRLIFGAATRASKWLYLSTDKRFFSPLRRILELSDKGRVRIDGCLGDGSELWPGLRLRS